MNNVKKHFFLMLLAFLMVWPLKAQTVTTTICDGIETGRYVPFYGYYTDMSPGPRSQCVYTADLLANLFPGSEISALTYYASFNLDVSSNTFEIYMKEVEYESISAWDDLTDATLVYTGGLVVADNQLHIDFSTDFTYHGGNLLISVQQTANGTECAPYDCAFYGIHSNGSAVYSYDSYGSLSVADFLPKLTITYVQGTPPACLRPTDLTVSDITAGSATVAWTEIGDAAEWEVMVNDEIYPATENSYALTDLTAYTNYTVRVRSICSETDTSEWSRAVTFTTDCDVLVLTDETPFFESFERSDLGCWSNEVGPNNGTYNYPWTVSTSASAAGSQSAYHNYYGNDYLVSPVFDLTGISTVPQLTFARKQYGGYYEVCDVLKLYYRANATDEWTLMEEYTTISDEFTVETIALPNSSATYQFAFEAITDDNYGIYIDSVVVEAGPSCSKPIGVTVSDITVNTATVAWIEVGDATEWEVEVNGIATTVTENPYQLTDLAASSDYTIRVRSICSETDISDWSAAVEIFTACDVIMVTDETPYFESFERSDLGCWRNEVGPNNGTYNHPWIVSTGDYLSGSQSVYHDYYGNDYLVSPVFDLTGISTVPQLVFAHKQYGYASCDALKLYYRTNTTDEWIPLEEYTTITDGFTFEDILLPNPSATYQIAFEAITNDNYGIYIDSVVVKAAPTCLKPEEVSASDITVNSAIIAWAESGDATAWEIKVNNEIYPVTENPYQLTDLAASTNYIVCVRSVCSETDTSEWSAVVEFRTDCGVVAITDDFSYFEDFEGSDLGCWSNENILGNSPWAVSTSYYFSRNQSARHSYTANTIDRLVSPVFDLTGISTVPQLIFACRNTGSQDTMILLYRVSEDAEWTELQTYPGGVYDEWAVMLCYLPEPSATYQFAFECRAHNGWGCYIDSVVVEAAPTCLKPVDVTVSDITINSATVTWTETGDATAWEVMVNDEIYPVTENLYLLTDLTDFTRYTIRVRSICSETDYSDWSPAVAFTTLCDVFTVTDDSPYFEDFEGDDLGCWNNEVGPNNGTYNYPWTVSTSYYSSGSQSAYHNYYGNDYLVSPIFDLTGLSTVPQLTFAYRQYGYTSCDILKLYYRTNLTDEWTLLEEYTTITNEFVIQNVILPAPSATYQFAFEAVTNNQYGIYIDSVVVKAGPDCPSPAAVAVSDVAINSATVTWIETGDAAAWEVDVNGIVTTVTENPYMLTDLTAHTHYTVRVRSICSETDTSDWSPTVAFTTLCDVFTVTDETPYFEDFEGSDLGCWNNEVGPDNGTYNHPWAVSTNYYLSGSQSVYHNYYGNDYLVSPIFDLTGISTVPQLTFAREQRAAYNNVCDTLRLYYRTNLTDEWTFLEEYATVSETFTVEDIVLPNPSTTYQFAFECRAHNGWGCSIDSVVVEAAPTCLKPVDVTVSDIAANSATVTWTESGDAAAWEIKVDNEIYPVAENSYALTDLIASTWYTIRVRSICSETDTSDWSTAVEFRTECDVIAVTDEIPYRDGFEHADFGCWSLINADDSQTWSLGTHYSYNVNEGAQYAIFLGQSFQGETSYLISPVFDITAVTTPTLIFEHAQAAWDADQNTLTVYYRANAADEWTSLADYTDNIINWQYDTITLPNPSATYQIAFFATANYGRPIAVDDFYVGNESSLVDTSCDAPTDFTVTVTDTTATIGMAGDASSWNVRYFINGGAEQTMTVTENPFTITGLEPYTTYNYQVQAICDTDRLSEWSEMQHFTTTNTGVGEYGSLSARVFPNPATDELNVRFSKNVSGEIAIYDVYGRLMRKEAINGLFITLNVSEFADGVYFLRVNDFIVKFVKK